MVAKKKSKSKRIEFTKDDMITIIKINEKLHLDVVVLQEACMNFQQRLTHEKWKFRNVARTLKQAAKRLGEPDLAVCEEELDKQIRKSEN